jgi:hypothetical protein
MCVVAAMPVLAQPAPAAVKYVHPDAAGKLSILGNVAIAISGNDRMMNRMMEWALAIHLLNQGIKVVYPAVTRGALPRPDDVADPMQYARTLGANAVITGMILTEPPPEEMDRTVLVSIANLTLTDLAYDKILLDVLYEPEKASPTVPIARAFAQAMAESLK